MKKTTPTTTIDRILHFWFEELSPQEKFAKNEAVDQVIKDRFEAVYWDAMANYTRTWRRTPLGSLAEIIALDQFPRNIFRGDGQTHAGDKKAVKLTKMALKKGFHRGLLDEQKLFMYLPLMHSEVLEDHVFSQTFFEAFGPKSMSLKSYWEHRNIIETFGRYPHRNVILNRKSTPDEIEFLKTHKGF